MRLVDIVAVPVSVILAMQGESFKIRWRETAGTCCLDLLRHGQVDQRQYGYEFELHLNLPVVLVVYTMRFVQHIIM
jgi:hypothetical protein